MNIKDLKAGDKVYIREDLEHMKCYGERMFILRMLDGKQEILKVDYDEQTFKIESEKPFAGFDYTPEMIDWEKTIKLRREKMDIKDLKVGDKVFIKSGMQHGNRYGGYTYVYDMGNGVKQVKSIYNDKGFGVMDGIGYYYTSEMIDWDKTEELNKAKYNHDTVHNPSHYGGGGKHNIECYKAIEYILDNLENVPEKYFGHVSNIVKYVWRCNNKNGYEDLDKASVYFDFMFREED